MSYLDKDVALRKATLAKTLHARITQWEDGGFCMASTQCDGTRDPVLRVVKFGNDEDGATYRLYRYFRVVNQWQVSCDAEVTDRAALIRHLIEVEMQP